MVIVGRRAIYLPSGRKPPVEVRPPGRTVQVWGYMAAVTARQRAGGGRVLLPFLHREALAPVERVAGRVAIYRLPGLGFEELNRRRGWVALGVVRRTPPAPDRIPGRLFVYRPGLGFEELNRRRGWVVLGMVRRAPPAPEPDRIPGQLFVYRLPGLGFNEFNRRRGRVWLPGVRRVTPIVVVGDADRALFVEFREKRLFVGFRDKRLFVTFREKQLLVE